MYVRDIMTTNVVTIPSSTSVVDARRIMTAHRIQRLPVVDRGRLVGIVTVRGLEQVSPAKADNITIWGLSHLLEGTQVSEIMKRHVITVPPDMLVEEAVSVAQSNKVGSLVVVEDGRMVGIVTTNDFFYRIVNPLMGVAKLGAQLPGTRIEVTGGGEGKELEKIISTANKLGMKISIVHTMPPVEGVNTKDICIHFENEDVTQFVSKLESEGYSVRLRKYS